MHLAKMLKGAGGVPGDGNVRSAWDAGTRFDVENPAPSPVCGIRQPRTSPIGKPDALSPSWAQEDGGFSGEDQEARA